MPINEFKNFRDFASSYFAGDYLALAQELMQKHKPPEKIRWMEKLGLSSWNFNNTKEVRVTKFRPKMKLKKIHKRFRRFDEHPLSLQEFEKAREYLRNCPEHHVALAAIQGCVHSFLEDFYKDFGRHYRTRPGSVVSMADQSTFLQTMSPTLAFLVTQNIEQGKEPWDNVLNAVFEKSTLQSFFPGSYVDPKNICPFSGPFGHVFSTDLNFLDGGQVDASQGNFGDLVETLKEDIRTKLTTEQLQSVSETYEFDY